MDDLNLQDPQLKEAIMKRLIRFQEVSQGLYDTVTKDNLVDWYNKYYADEGYYDRKFPHLSKSSKLISTDIADTIEWALPSLMRIFFGSDKVITIQGRGTQGEDEKKALLFEQLLNFQLTNRNNGFLIFYNWMKDSLITGVGIVKAYWIRETEDQERQEIMSAYAIQEMGMDENIQIIDIQPNDEYNVEFTVTYIQNTPIISEPRIENILASEFRYLPKTRDIKQSPYVAHKKKVTLDHLRKMEKEGIYSNIEQVQREGQKATTMDDELEEVVDDTMDSMFRYNWIDEVDQEYELWEQYIDIDMNQDGMNEKWIITSCGNVIVRMEPNKYGRPPFFLLSPSKDPHRLWPKRSYADLIGQLQDLKVALTRQLVKGIALSNEPRMVIDEEAINVHDLIEGKQWIRKKPGVPMDNAVYQIQNVQLHPWTFEMLEYANSEKENRTGITKYNQGMDSRSLNKTATGISAIMSASNQRLELIARMFAETEVKELYTFLITLNQKFLDMKTIVRLTNEVVEVDPADLGGGYDLIVNAGIGMGTKENKVLNLQTIVTTMEQMMGAGIPIVTPDNFYNVLRRLFEEMGEKNIDQYLTAPQAVIQQQMMEAFQKLPPQLQQAVQSGQLTLQEAMTIYEGAMANGRGTLAQGAPQANGNNRPSAPSQTNNGVSGQLVGERKRKDNRVPQNVPRKRPQQG